MAQIRLSDIDKVYDNGFTAVADLNLDIQNGEFLVLVGPSGCGKSTALRMIAGLETVSKGDLFIGDKRVNDLEPKDRDIAMVFQSYALYPHLTVRENIAFAMKLRRMPKEDIEERVQEAARILELSELLDKRPGQLSGGQRQRVAMGRAIVRHPEAFLMDEPLSNLDAKLRVQMRAEISKLQRRLGVTTVYVTHDQVEAMTMGDRVAVMSKGLLQQVDTPQNLYDHPKNLFVATFIGSPQMNTFVGRYTHGTDGGRIVAGAQSIAVPQSVINRRPSLAKYDGRDVVVGIRPEHLHDSSLQPGPVTVSGSVEVREGLGSEVLLHVEVDVQAVRTDAHEDVPGSERLSAIARVAPTSTLKPGDTAVLTVDAEQLHLFDVETGDSIN
ncbi:MAG: hypothetical protein RJA47_473 [Actinomycetota bacterium]|jgi:multiple sugar transport system ATP-binding protein